MTTGIGILAAAVLALVVVSAAVACGLRARGCETSAPAASLVSEAPFSAEAILWAIRQMESGDNPQAVGKKGERTAYQFMPATWARYTEMPLVMAAQSPEHVERIAKKHLGRVLRELDRRNLPCEPEFVAAAWRHGEKFFVIHARQEYARRVAALYYDRIGGAK